jgi:hypothetical protein
MAIGSKVVAGIAVVLAAFFAYQWWFNPVRAIERRLGRLAAVLSVPAVDTDLGRVTRVAALGRYFAEDVRISAGEGGPQVVSRDALLAVVSSFRPPAGGWDVQFVDVQVTLDSDDAARAYMTVEITGTDARTGERTVDAREADVALAKRGGEWVITTAASKETLTRP